MKATLRRLAPQWVCDRLDERYVARRAEEFRRRALQPTVTATATAVCDSNLEFCAGQSASEIAAFLELVRTANPTTIAEIGSSRGGNLLLFSCVLGPRAKLISLERDLTRCLRQVYRRLVGPIHLRCIGGDSQAKATRTRFRTALGRRKLDVLFIDGDHSYEGVKADFELYAPFVRPGGLVAFHDIVPDALQRFGRPTPSRTGEVPRFWNELRSDFADVWEFIEDPDQDGFGIGVIRWPG